MSDALTRLTAALSDRYRIERELGQGGMATVYLAHDVKHDRKVAIKVLNEDVGAALGADRFLREIRTTATLRHPGIVPLYDSGVAEAPVTTQDSRPATFLYYVMPSIEGTSLRDLMTSETVLPVEDALRITREIADALEHAHAHGVIHRDVKPENVMLEGGHAVVADFGIARAVSSPGGDRLTQTGTSVGTPMYMSPEQGAGDDVDGRSDQYSLACVCFEMLAGQPPFTGPNAMAIARQHSIADPPSIVNLRAGVPANTAHALQRALSKASADRYPTVAQFGMAIGETILSGSVAPTPPSFQRRARTRAMIVSILATIAAMIVLGFWMRGSRTVGRGATARASIAVLPFVDESPDHSNAYIGDGIAETLTNALANIVDLAVAARTSAFAYRDRRDDLRGMARELQVTTVLDGSVQRVGNQLRITAQLVPTDGGKPLWSQQFDRSAADIFAVQDEVARAVVDALRLRLSPRADSLDAEAGTRSPAAYDAYLLGRYHWNRRTADGMVQATVAFKRAVALDSGYARAWSGLADAYILSIPEEYPVAGLNRDSALTWSERAARRALALAPQLGEAEASLGEVLDYTGHREEAGRAFRQAIALSPNYATGHQWYSYFLSEELRMEEARREMEIAHRLDPLSHVITLSLAIGLDGLNRFDEATPLYAQGLAQSPEAWYAWSFKIGHELSYGRIDSALVALREVLRSRNVDSSHIADVEHGLRDPVTRSTTIDALVRSGDSFEALILARWLLGDEAAVHLLTVLAGKSIRGFSSMYAYSALGPKLSVDPRVQAAGRRLGWPAVSQPAANQ